MRQAFACLVAMRAILLTCLLLAFVAIGTASVADAAPAPPPLVGECNFLTNPCWNGDALCVWFSLQVPQCLPPIVVT
jgi:hypothetical protein